MALDPTARFVIKAEDQTARATASAAANLEKLARTAGRTQSIITGIAGGFAGVIGVASLRQMGRWVAGSIETTDALGEQAIAIERARASMEKFADVMDKVGESLAIVLAPALELVADAAEAARKSLIPTEIERFNSEIAETEKRIGELTARLDSLSAPRKFLGLEITPTERQLTRERIMLTRQLAEAQERLQSLIETAPRMPLPTITPEERRALEETIGWLNASPLPDITEQERRALEETIELMNTVPQQIAVADWTPEDAEAFMRQIEKLGAMPLPDLTDAEREMLEDFVDTLEEMDKAAAHTAARMGMSFQDAFTDWMLGTERDFSELLRRMVAEMAVSGIFSAIGGVFAGGSGPFARFASAFFGGSRASGGPVSAGRVYRVHEGEAFFSPATSGRVGNVGGVTVNIGETHIDARGADASLLQRLPRILDDHRQRTKAEIAELMRRGRFA